ncbi:hypothetical protein RR42_m3177 [Cupriavidus basilensis]|uniref:Uncharacterized protein n=1 Tax=Cupriavidus basilensis TaxID=68895 RepID=A0A0C4YIJ6_9BURK|nr:hypothetical protein RR42_m3177 [Cupriavidus basilensis]
MRRPHQPQYACHGESRWHEACGPAHMAERGDLFWFVCGASAARERRARIFASTSASCWCCAAHRAGAAVAVASLTVKRRACHVPVMCLMRACFGVRRMPLRHIEVRAR